MSNLPIDQMVSDAETLAAMTAGVMFHGRELGPVVCDHVKELALEEERLQRFYDSVISVMHENAGNLNSPFAYIYQKEWEKIKEAAEKARDA